MSEGNLCAPVTMSRPLGRGAGVPSTFHSFTAVKVTSGGNGLLQGLGRVLAGGKVGVGQRALAGGVMDDLAVVHFDGVAAPRPTAGRQVDQQLARRRGALADGGNRPGRAAAAGGDAVIGHQAGVGHEQLDAADRHAQFLGGRLAQLGPRALARLDLAGHDGDGSVLAEVDPAPKCVRAPGRRPAPPPPLGQGRQAADGDQESRAQDLDKRAPAQAEIVIRRGLLGCPRVSASALSCWIGLRSPFMVVLPPGLAGRRGGWP